MKKTTKSAKETTPEGEEKFPGYPKYPAQEDIMSRADRVEMDLDGDETPAPASSTKVPKTGGKHHSASDLTKDDFEALGDKELESDGDDQLLKDRVYPVDFAGDDLDIPGSSDDDAQEDIGNEDEENNSYSLGGDNHNDLEEDQS
ncbi:hypothetical protein [Chryseolinea lacunae]|uniref:Uncharacterized protein n=1 Tax=Chryseolinea lacunae TaxID=2801331 RepID=A0ABS1L100_9BACT|nr:hypothetical protein [Chryseolinea lacunae]MBL0744607.1 hypothetical protein [Chryseolinea lacunae]